MTLASIAGSQARQEQLRIENDLLRKKKELLKGDTKKEGEPLIPEEGQINAALLALFGSVGDDISEKIGLTMDDFGDVFSGDMEDILGSFGDVFIGDLDDVMGSFGSDLLGNLGGLFGGGGGGGGGGDGGGFDLLGAVGDIFSGPLEKVFKGFFKHGGELRKGQFGVVGEAGPELFAPKTTGTIIPLSKISGGRETLTIVNNMNFSMGVQDTVRAEILNAMPQIQRSTQQGVLNAISSGGKFAKAVGRKQ